MNATKPLLVAMLVITISIASGCKRDEKPRIIQGQGAGGETSGPITGQAGEEAPVSDTATAVEAGSRRVVWPARPALDMKSNPTTDAGRGTPGLDDQHAPCAWAWVDGKAGEFRSTEDGKKLLQWFIDAPVSSRPTFRIEALEPLVGKVTDVNIVFQSADTAPEDTVLLGIRTEKGEFEAGKVYDLAALGPEFIITDIRNARTLEEFPRLAPGQYGMVCKIENRTSNLETLAVTYFVVGAE